MKCPPPCPLGGIQCLWMLQAQTVWVSFPLEARCALQQFDFVITRGTKPRTGLVTLQSFVDLSPGGTPHQRSLHARFDMHNVPDNEGQATSLPLAETLNAGIIKLNLKSVKCENQSENTHSNSFLLCCVSGNEPAAWLSFLRRNKMPGCLCKQTETKFGELKQCRNMHFRFWEKTRCFALLADKCEARKMKVTEKQL